MPAPSRLLKLQAFAGRGLHALRLSAANTPMRLALFSLLAVVARWPSLKSAAGLNDFRDAHYLYQYEDAARRAVLQFQQLPLWDPYYCGGVYELGSPQARYLSPTFLVTLLFGTTRAEPVIALLMLIVGMEGAYRYARARRVSSLGALCAAPVFGLSGVFAFSLKLGWVHFYGFALTPWVLLGLRLALQGSRAGLVVAAAAIAWMVGFGGTYAAPLTAVFCALECAGVAIRMRRSRKRLVRAALMAAAVVALGAGLGAAKLWPLAETLSAAPRLLEDKPTVSYAQLASHLIGTWESRGRGEYMVGLLAIPVALVALRRRRALFIAAAFALACWLATGYASTPSAFRFLRHLPIYGMLRYPERFLVLAALMLSVLAALGIHNLTICARRRPWVAWAQWAAVGLLAVNAWFLIGNHRYQQRHTTLMIAPVEVQQPFQQARGNRWLAAYYPAMSRGSLSCFDDYDLPQSPLLRGDLQHDEYLLDTSAGTVERTSWSPNRLELAVELSRPTRVRVNQNYHEGWRANTGEVVNDLGLLAVELPAGRHALTLRFLPRSAVGGIALSAVSLCVLALVWRQRRRWGDTVQSPRHAARLLGWGGAPLAAAVLYALVLRPPRPQPVIVTPTGEAAVVSSLPPGSQPMQVVFENGVRLEGARLSHDTSGAVPRIVVELNFRIPEHVPAGLGVFVHLRAPDGKNHTMDHVRLAAAVPFENAPRNVLIRDIGAWEVIDKPRGEWVATAGLWMARRDGARVKVTSAGGAEVRDNGVTVGRVSTR
jgi:hypothetical protein